MTQKPSADLFSPTEDQQKLTDSILALLESDLAKAHQGLKEKLNEREYDWWSTVQSGLKLLELTRDNKKHYEAGTDAWRLAVTTAISLRFFELLKLLGTSGPVSVAWAKDTMVAVLERKALPRNALAELLLPDGQEYMSAPGVPGGDLDGVLTELLLPIDAHLERISQQAMVDAAIVEPRHGSPAVPQNQFVKEGQTWSIVFEGETCRLPVGLDGLDYISLLLASPLKAIAAGELYSSVSRSPVVSADFTHAATASISEHAGDPGDEHRASFSQVRFGADNALDFRAQREYQQRLAELEQQCTLALEGGDGKKAAELQQEYDIIQDELKTSTWRGRSKSLDKTNERHRQTVTNAIRRAYKLLRQEAPSLADYLQKSITTGSQFMYRDGQVAWTVTPPSR